MKSNAFNKAIIYDDCCPLCAAYTNAFVKSGMLRSENRLAFSKVSSCRFKIDWQRAKNEIPLVDVDTGEVKYGVDAITEVLQQKLRFAKAVMKIKVLHWFFRKIYTIISYNRRLIVADHITKKCENDCTPDYSYKWRWMLVLINLICSFIMLRHANSILKTEFHKTVSLITWMCWLLIPPFIILFPRKKNITEIYAQASLIILVAAFLMLILFWAKKIFLLPQWLFFLFFVCCVIIIMREVRRRYLYIQKMRIC